MTSKIKVDNITDQNDNNIINESGDVITDGAGIPTALVLTVNLVVHLDIMQVEVVEEQMWLPQVQEQALQVVMVEIILVVAALVLVIMVLMLETVDLE